MLAMKQHTVVNWYNLKIYYNKGRSTYVYLLLKGGSKLQWKKYQFLLYRLSKCVVTQF